MFLLAGRRGADGFDCREWQRASMSRRKAVELANPELAADAETYDVDGRYLATPRGTST